MAIHIQLYVAVCILSAVVPAPAAAVDPTGAPGILNVATLPYLGAAGRADYRRFLQQATPRAFSLSAEGTRGWAAALDSPAATEARAIEICGQWGGSGCRLYARDLSRLR